MNIDRTLDPERCRRAHLARDPRFDGEFFLGVVTTGIYCRPICPARPAAARNVRYFRYPAQAAAAGFRPCLRCRPEAAPGSPAWRGSGTTVQRALQLIRAGALDGGATVPGLAERLGVGERYLRKLFARELGLAPQAVAQHQRLLLARQLVVETAMPLADVAYAAGFGSLRRFNAAIRESYGVAPGALRRGAGGPVSDRLTLNLAYRPPYDWQGVLAFRERHALAGVESVRDGAWHARVAHEGQVIEVSVRQRRDRDALAVTLHLSTPQPLPPLVATLRRMFDLDANPAELAQAFAGDRQLAPLLARFPGIRLPGFWDAAEAAVRALVGQQVSTAAARTVLGRLAAACAAGGEARVFPAPAAIAALADSELPVPARRRAALRSLAAARDYQPATLAGLAGIGPWTCAMVALRGCGDPDAFPSSDLGLRRAWAELGGEPARLGDAAARWRPFRGYAANLLWRSL